MSVDDRIQQLINENAILLFMKGSPKFPQCGFSSLACQILDACGTKFTAVDVYKAAEQKYRRDRERWAVGWICYLMAIVQYLIIGLVTSRDRAVDVLNEFDRAVARRRQELIEEFSLDEAEHQQETEVDRSQPADNDSDGPTDPRDTTRESSAAERREPGIE